MRIIASVLLAAPPHDGTFDRRWERLPKLSSSPVATRVPLPL
jgi:hypothetical protein